MSLLDWLNEDLSDLLLQSLYVPSASTFHFSSDRLLLEQSCWDQQKISPLTPRAWLTQAHDSVRFYLESLLTTLNVELLDQVGSVSLSDIETKASQTKRALMQRSFIMFNRELITPLLSRECLEVYRSLKRCERDLSWLSD